MKDTLLEIGCDGGCIVIHRIFVNGLPLFKLYTFEEDKTDLGTYLYISEAWTKLKHRYPMWYQLYLISIDTQMIDLVKPEYLKVNDKSEYTRSSWLEQLTGEGLGF